MRNKDDVVTDHDHVNTYLGQGKFVGSRCAVCGERVNVHLSYGRELAEILGGDPRDYLG